MNEVFARHEKAALQFSGGKDSLACLWLTKPWWDKITVMWANTGAAFPETVELMQKVRALVPHFLEVRTNVFERIADKGYPVDVLPVLHHDSLRSIAQPELKLQTFMECCVSSIMWPLYEAMKAHGATLLVRGQKAADRLKGPLHTGHIEDGIEFLYPIEGWTDKDVRAYLLDAPFGLPAHYAYTNTSLDCWCCTAYLQDNVGKMRLMREHYPAWHAIVKGRLSEVKNAIQAHDWIEEAMEA